eukprot:Colp12_sorted_trinity150504_noHs@20186
MTDLKTNNKEWNSPPSDKEEQLAERARKEFESRRYDACISCLTELSKLRPKDPKVVHNLAVSKFLKADEVGVFQLRADIEEIAKQLSSSQEELAEQLSLSVESSAVQYNAALIDFQLRKYRSAAERLETLFKVIEPIDNVLSEKICILLLDTYLSLKQADKAAVVLSYLDKLYSSLLQERRDDNGTRKDEKKPTSKEDSPENELRFRLHLYKARIHLLTRSMKLVKREIKTALAINSQNRIALCLKGNFEYLRLNFKKSMKLLNTLPKELPPAGNSTSSNQGTPPWNVVHYNNVGCVYSSMKKHNLAAFYFGKALKEMEAPGAHAQSSLVTVSCDRRREVLYNLGVQLLYMERPAQAFACLSEALPFFYQSPTMWLRLAECCIAHHVAKTQSTPTAHAAPVGSGLVRKQLIITPEERPTAGSAQQTEGPSLSVALRSLRNALFLLDTPPPARSEPGSST